MMVACLCPNILAIVETQYLCQTLMIVDHYGSMRLAKWLNQPYEFGTLVNPTTFYGESCAWPTLHAAKSQEFKKLFVEAELQMREVPVKHGAPIDPLVISGSETNHHWGHFEPYGGKCWTTFWGSQDLDTSDLQESFDSWRCWCNPSGCAKFQAKCCQLAVVAGTHLQLLWLRRWILPWIPIWLRRCCWVHIEVSICVSSLYFGVRLGWKIHGCHHGIWTPSWDISL